MCVCARVPAPEHARLLDLRSELIRLMSDEFSKRIKNTVCYTFTDLGDPSLGAGGVYIREMIRMFLPQNWRGAPHTKKSVSLLTSAAWLGGRSICWMFQTDTVWLKPRTEAP